MRENMRVNEDVDGQSECGLVEECGEDERRKYEFAECEQHCLWCCFLDTSIFSFLSRDVGRSW
jgi:hypothetical protein